MPRPISAAMLAALCAPQLNPAIFVEMHFVGTTVYLWSGQGSITWNGQTWNGSFLDISLPADGTQVEAKGLVLTFFGLDPTVAPLVQAYFKSGQPVKVYLGLYSAGSLIDSPVIAWAGRMDQPTFRISPEDLTLSINCETRLLDMNIPVAFLYTNEQQQALYPGDLGFSFVDSIQEKTLFFGGYPGGYKTS